MRARVAGLVAGRPYTVRWREISADGHVGTGVFTFGVAVDPPPPTEAVGSSGMTWRDDVARWALFASLALMIGVVGHPPARSAARRRRPGRAARLSPRHARRGPGAQRWDHRVRHPLGERPAGVGGRPPLRGPLAVRRVDSVRDRVPGHDARLRHLPHDPRRRLGPRPAGTPLAGIPPRARPRLGLPALRAPGDRAERLALGEVADWVHLVTAMLWVGGVLTLAVVVWPLAPDLRRAAFLRFSRIAVFLIGVLVIAGTVVAIERLPEPADLWTMPYGRTLLVKIGLVLVALAWGGFHHTFVRPRLERGEPTPGVGQSLLGESVVAMAVLLAAAVLVNGARLPSDRRLERRAARRSPNVGSFPGLRVAISGGAGFLGLHLSRRLVAEGHDVRILDLAPLDDAGARGPRRARRAPPAPGRRAGRGQASARRGRRRPGAVRDAGRGSPRRRRSRPARRGTLDDQRPDARTAPDVPVSTGGGLPFTRTAAARSTAIATALSPSRLRPTPDGVWPRSRRGRTTRW